MSVHVIGVIGLILIFVIGTVRPINLGALGLVMTYVVGSAVVGEGVGEMFAGFPVDLLVLLVGVTYLFGVASVNGTVERIVNGAARVVQGRRMLIPWLVFVVASLPAMAGALGSAGVAMLAPLAMRLAERYQIDRRMVGLMVVHGAAAGNFSPLNVLSAIVLNAVRKNGLSMSSTTLFLANVGYNVALAACIFVLFGGMWGDRKPAADPQNLWKTPPTPFPQAADIETPEGQTRGFTVAQISTMLSLAAVAAGAFVLGLNIGFLALGAAVLLHLTFPAQSARADQRISWSVVLLVCGIVTYIAALQRYGTMTAVGAGLAGIGSPLVTGLLLCALAAITSAFASSAGILGATIPLAAPILAQGALGTTGLIVAIAISATVVDATPFSTVGALVVASANREEQTTIYSGLLRWGFVMVVTAPILTWLLFILPSR